MPQKAYLSRLSLIELQGKTWVSGNVLKGKSIPQNGKSKWSHFLFVLRSYFRSPIKNVTFQAKLGQETIELQTDGKGHFSQIIDLPLPTDFSFSYQDHPLGLSEDYPLLFPKANTEVEVISDLDDTVLVSHTASALKRIRNILFLAPQKKKNILYTFHLMQAFKELRWRVHYLSKSESNLYQVIADFIDYHQLPKGALLLSPHLRWNQVHKPNKGKDYKLKQLRELIQNLAEKKFILLGDDTQRDMEIYTQVIEEFRDRILMVFIRQTNFNRSKKQEEMWQKLKKSSVEAIYFDDQQSPEQAIEKIKQV
ncbi:MAG: App1 family protein [Vicingaceae bacterium]